MPVNIEQWRAEIGSCDSFNFNFKELLNLLNKDGRIISALLNLFISWQLITLVNILWFSFDILLLLGIQRFLICIL